MVSTYQSNNREYKVLAKPSLPTTAATGSRLLLITSSGVTITRFNSASSNPLRSHLVLKLSPFNTTKKKVYKKGCQQKKAIAILEKFYRCLEMELRFVIF